MMQQTEWTYFSMASFNIFLRTLLCGFAILLSGHCAPAQDAGTNQRLGSQDPNTTKPADNTSTTPSQQVSGPASAQVKASMDPSRDAQPEVLTQPRYFWTEEARDQSSVIEVSAPQIVSLSSMNENAASAPYTDRAHGPFTFAVEATGVYTTNLLNEYNNTTGGGGYADIGLPLRFRLESPRTNLSFFTRTNFSLYPGNTSYNHNSSIFSADLNQRISPLTQWSMAFAGGRTTGIGTYLPPVIPVGTTALVQPGQINGLAPSYNLAGTFGITHLMSARNRLVTTATGSWLQLTEAAATHTSYAQLTRQESASGDVHFFHALTPRKAVGVELTNLYVRGLTPVGHSNYTSVKGTYQYALSEHGWFEFGVGPLFYLTNSQSLGHSADWTYAANASVTYQTGYGKMTAGYERVVQLGYLESSSAANDAFGVYDRPLNHYMDLTADMRYVRMGGTPHQASSYNTIAATGRLNFNYTSFLVFYFGSAYFHQGSNVGVLSHEDVTAGLTYTFGSPLARKGVR